MWALVDTKKVDTTLHYNKGVHTITKKHQKQKSIESHA